MSLNKCLMTLISLILLSLTQVSYAACTRGPAKTIKLNMDIGRIVVNPKVGVGSVIVEKQFRLPDGDENDYFYYCTGYNDFVGDLDAAVKHGGDSNQVYQTNIPGIGMRFALRRDFGTAVNMIYYGSVNRYSGLGSRYFLRGQSFVLQIIKTAKVTGSGTLKPGRYTFYNEKMLGGQNPILETYLTGSSVTIVSPSCTVSGGENMNIDVGSVNRTALERVGATAGGKNFNITLRCAGGSTESGFSNIRATFSGTRAPNTAAANGVLINEKSGERMAQGVGIQILHDNVPLVFYQKYLMGGAAANTITELVFPLRAQFYRYGTPFSTGEVQSHMIFNLTYD